MRRGSAEPPPKGPPRGTHRSVKNLTAPTGTWTATWNENPGPYIGHKTADEILETLAAYCQRINHSGH